MNSKYFSLKEKKIPLPFFFCSFASPLGFSFLTKILFIDLKIEFFCHYLVLIRENVQISKSNLESDWNIEGWAWLRHQVCNFASVEWVGILQ